MPTAENDAQLRLLQVKASSGVLPARVSEFLTESEARLREFLERRGASAYGLVPSDFEGLFRVLSAVCETYPVDSYCEWGSGIGAGCGLAALCGLDSCGIEIQPELVEVSRELLDAFELDVEILEGSFCPEAILPPEDVVPAETVTIVSGAGATDEVDVAVSDFDVIYSFPWPGEEEMYREIFRREAAGGAYLILYEGPDEGFSIWRKELFAS